MRAFNKIVGLRRILFYVLTWLILATPCHATLFSWLGGDEAIAKAGSEADRVLDHAHSVAQALLVSGDVAAQARLNQINGIANRAFAQASELENKSDKDVLEIIVKAKESILNIEVRLMSDLDQLIWNAECSGKRVVITDLQNALGGFGRLLGTHEILITPPIKKLHAWYCFWCSGDEVKFKIREPFADTYIEIREYMEDSLQHASDDDSAYTVVETYEYLAELSKKTSCFYPGSPRAYVDEYVKYRQKAANWRDLMAIYLGK